MLVITGALTGWVALRPVGNLVVAECEVSFSDDGRLLSFSDDGRLPPLPLLFEPLRSSLCDRVCERSLRSI